MYRPNYQGIVDILFSQSTADLVGKTLEHGVDGPTMQMLFRFPNGFGASVVQHCFSYGSSSGQFELAVLEFTEDGDSDNPTGTWSLCYTTHITSDVEGYRTAEEIISLLDEIRALPAIYSPVMENPYKYTWLSSQ